MVKTNNSAPKSKEKSERTNIGAKGGSTKMFGKSGAAPQQPGMASDATLPKFDKLPAKGGKTGVMGKQRGASPSRPGQVSVGPSGSSDNTFKVSGGKGHMAGFTPAANAKSR